MDQKLQYFGEQITKGELVAFPTETVYGVGANAFDAKAVAKIFAVKGRPSDNPLIVHVSSFEEISKVASSIDELSKKIFEKFSPGPITVLLPKQDTIPEIVTAHSPLVGVRIPSHPIALEFLRAAGVPVAAPSANKSGKPSATNHTQVIEAFGTELPNVIVGGDASFGLESTVVLAKDQKQITILRQGAISQEELQNAFPEVEVVIATQADLQNAPSPGIKYKHYAPKGKVTLLETENSVPEIINWYEKHRNEAAVVVCSTEMSMKLPKDIPFLSLGSETDLSEIARNLYSTLIACDSRNATQILIQSFPEKGIGRTIMERILRIVIDTTLEVV